MELENLSIDIATCISNSSTGSVRIYCLDEDLNYCCKLNNASNLIVDSGERFCCTYEDYADQQWVIMASIQGLTLLLIIIFCYFLLVFCWFYITTFTIKKEAVNVTRKRIIKHLLKKQLLHKSSRGSEASLASNIRNLSKTFSSTLSKSSSKSRKDVKKSMKSDERKPLIGANKKLTKATIKESNKTPSQLHRSFHLKKAIQRTLGKTPQRFPLKTSETISNSGKAKAKPTTSPKSKVRFKSVSSSLPFSQQSLRKNSTFIKIISPK